MAQQKSGWNLFSFWKKQEGKKVDHRRRSLALETLEGRVVPATVVNPLDSTNPSFPVPGSLRWAIANAESGETIDFDVSAIKANYPDFYNPATDQITITLNGAVGSLRVVDYNLVIQDSINPRTEEPTFNQFGKPFIKLQADRGIAKLAPDVFDSDGNLESSGNIVEPGKNYRIGDTIQQGTEQVGGTFYGGALFQVTKVGPIGEVLELAVLNTGANGNWDKLTKSDLKSIELSSDQLGQLSINPLQSGAGTGLKLGNLTHDNFGYASDLFLVDPQQSNLNDGTSFSKFTLQNIELADARTTAVQVNLGRLQVDYCVFGVSENNFEQDTFINTTQFATGLSINQSNFESAFRYMSAYKQPGEPDPESGFYQLIQKNQGISTLFPISEFLNLDTTQPVNFTLGDNGTGQVTMASTYLNIQAGQLIKLFNPADPETYQVGKVTYYNPLDVSVPNGANRRALAFEKLWSEGSGTPDISWQVDLLSNIIEGGTGYEPGDLLEQGFDGLTTGGAQFRVTQVGPNGNIKGLEVFVGGDNATTQSLLVSNNLKESKSRVLENKNSSFYKLETKSGTGSGAVLGFFADINFGKTYLRVQTNPSVQVNYAGAGLVDIRDSSFEKAVNSLQVASGSTTLDTNLAVSDSSFQQGRVISEASTSAITRSYFTNALDGALELGGSTATITDSYFNNNTRTSGIQINATSYLSPLTNTILNTNALQYRDVPLYNYLEYSDSNGNVQIVGPTTDYASQAPSSPNPTFFKPNPNRGGGAIYAWSGRRLALNYQNTTPPTVPYSLTVSKTLFTNNSAEGLNTFNAGGGAIYSNSGEGTLILDQVGFTENQSWITAYPSLDGATDADFGANPEEMPSAANSGGGALYAGGPLTISNSYFNKNTLKSSVDYWAPPLGQNSGTPQYSGGGALYTTSNDAATIDAALENVTLVGNSAEQSIGPDGKVVVNAYVGALVTNVVARMPDVAGSALDFNRDGIADLLVGTDALANNIDVRLGTVDTTQDSLNLSNNYSIVSKYCTTGFAIPRNGLTSGDFDGDGLPDIAALVVDNFNFTNTYVYVFLNKGLEQESNPNSWLGFSAPVQFWTKTRSGLSLAAGDLNRDGLDDLVVASKGNNTSFATATAKMIGEKIQYDFSITPPSSDNTASGLLNNSELTCMTLAWLNGDQYPDLVLGYNSIEVAQDTFYNLQVLLNSGLQGVNQTRVWRYPPVYTFNVTGDVSEDVDVAAISKGDYSGDNDLFQDISAAAVDAVWVMRNRNTSDRPRFDTTWSTDADTDLVALHSADLNNDQTDDLMWASDSDNVFNYTLGTGAATFGVVYGYEFTNTAGDKTTKGSTLTAIESWVGGEKRLNVVVGQELTGNPFAAEPEPGNIWIGYNTLPDGEQGVEAINFYISPIGQPEFSGNTTTTNPANATKFFVLSRGLGLNGGALISATGVDPSLPNNVVERAFDGTSTVTITNTTISGNTLENNQILSEPDATSAAGGTNDANTGGLFNNTGSGSSLTIQNSILHSNNGIQFTRTVQNTYRPLATVTNSSQRPGAGSYLSKGNNLYNHVQNAMITLLSGASGDITTEPTAPVFFFGGLGNYQGPIIGLNPFAEIGSSSTSFAIPTRVTPGTTATFTVRGFTSNDIRTGDLIRLVVDGPPGQTEAYIQGILQSFTPSSGRITSITLQLQSSTGWGTHRNWIVYKENGPPQMESLSPPELICTSDSAYILPLTINPVSFTCQDIPANSLEFGDTVRLEAVDLPGAFVEGQLTSEPTVVGGITTLSVSVLSQKGAGTASMWTVYKIPKPANLGQSNILTLPLDRLSPARDTGSNSVFPTPLATDARGFPRKLNIAVDMGAYEVQAGTKITAIPSAVSIFSGTSSKIAVEVRFDDTLGYSDPGELLQGTVSLLNPRFPEKVYAIAQLNAARGVGIADLYVNQPGMPDLEPGQQDYIVVYSGNLNYAISQTNPFRLTVVDGKKAQLGLDITPPSPATYGTPVTLTANLKNEGNSPITGGTIQFYAMVEDGKGGTTRTFLSPPLNVMNGDQQQATFTLQVPTLPGNTTLVGVDYSGFNDYLPASASKNYVVSKGSTKTTLTLSGNRIDRSPQTLTVQVAAQPSFVFPPAGQVRILVNSSPYGLPQNLNGGQASIQFTPKGPGIYTIEAQYLGDSSYTVSSGMITETITPAKVEDFVLTAPQSGSIIQIQRRTTDPETGAIQITQETVLQPLGVGYTGGFTVAQGDVTGDGVEDILYSPRIGGNVNVIDGYSLQPIGAFYPFGGPQSFPLSLAVGDLNADGRGDIIVAPAGIGLPPHVVIFSPDQIGQLNPQALASFYAYSPQFKGGVSVAAGEVEGGGGQEVITAPLVGAAPHIAVFQYAQANQNVPPSFRVIQSYYAYSPLYMGGTAITAGDLNGDGFVEIITAASAAAPHIVVIDSRTQAVKASFYAGYGNTYGGGVRVTTLDYNNDGTRDIVASAGAGRAPELFVYDGTLAFQGQVLDPAFLADSFFAFGPSLPGANYLGGVFVG